MTLFPALLLALAVSGGDNTQQAPDQLQCNRGFEPLKQEIISTPGITPLSANVEFEAFEDSANYIVYTFTKPGHYAHPAIIRRAIVKSGGALHIATTACCYNTKENCTRLLKEFKALDSQVRSDFKAGSQQ